MTFPTHIVFSQFFFISFSSAFDHRVSATEILLVSIGSILPYIDTPHSIIGRTFKPISLFLNKKFSHRGAVHSLPFSLVLLLVPVWGLYLFVGFLSHLLLDMATKTGVMFFYPLDLVAVIPRKDEWRIKTGSIHEFFLFLVFSALLTVSMKMNMMGSERMINRIIKTTRSVISEMMKLGDDVDVYVRIEGKFTFSNERADGIYRVISRIDENTLLVEKDGEAYSVGRRREDEINADKIWIERIRKMGWRATKIDLTGLSVEDLKSIPGRMYGSGTLLYPANLSDPMIRFPTLQGAGRKIKIVWAKGEDFERLGKNLFLNGLIVVRYNGGNFNLPKYSNVRVYKLDMKFGDILKVNEGMKVKKGDTIVSREYRRKRLTEQIDEKKKKIEKLDLMKFPSLISIEENDLKGYMRLMEEKKKRISRDVEKLVNDMLKAQDVTVEKDGIVKIVNLKKGEIVISEYK